MEGGTNPQEPEKLYEHKSWGDRAEILARWIVDLFSFPVSLAGAILAQFFKPGTSGARLVGGIGFGIGVLLGADGVWQLLFQGPPLFPFFEKGWIGWSGWVILPFNLMFWLSVGISALVQIMEAKTLRGKSPEEAKKEFEGSLQYKLPQKPQGVIDYTRAAWGDYKSAGMRERNGGGLIAAFFWIFDLIITFGSRNPFAYTNPGQIMACFAYNCVTMIAGEIGYKTWQEAKKAR